MPLVTVASSPNGEPIATTPWPTWSESEDPMVAGVRPLTSSAWITAVSVSGSVPDDLGRWRAMPSLKDTSSSPESPATSTTWLLVRIWPSEVRMMPEPEPCALGAGHVDLHDRRQHRLGHLLDRAVARTRRPGCRRPATSSAGPTTTPCSRRAGRSTRRRHRRPRRHRRAAPRRRPRRRRRPGRRLRSIGAAAGRRARTRRPAAAGCRTDDTVGWGWGCGLVRVLGRLGHISRLGA